MTRDLSAEAPQPEAQQRPKGSDRVAAWLRRRLSALRPRTRRHYVTLAALLLLALFVAAEWRATTIFSTQVVVMPRTDELIVGLNPTTERIDFGDLSQGSSQTRPLTLENSSFVPLRVSIIILGDIGQFVAISDAFFTLHRGETRDVEFTLVLPPNAEPKKYSGRVLVIRIPWIPWL